MNTSLQDRPRPRMVRPMNPLRGPARVLPGLERMTRTALTASLFVLVSVGGTAETLVPADAARRLAQASNALGIDLYDRLRARPGNLAISPRASAMALGMPWGRRAGRDGRANGEVLRLEGTPGGGPGRVWGAGHGPHRTRSRPVTLRIANRLFGERANRFDPPTSTPRAPPSGPPSSRWTSSGAPEDAAAASTVGGRETSKPDPGPRTAQRDQPGTQLPGQRPLLPRRLGGAVRAGGHRPAPFHCRATDQKDVPTMHRTGTGSGFFGDGLRALALP